MGEGEGGTMSKNIDPAYRLVKYSSLRFKVL